jgi:signal transduction histidine kinase
MTLAQFRGLTLRMLVFAAAALLPVLLLMAWMGWLGTEEKVAQERIRAAHLAEILAREQALPFALGKQRLQDLALMRAFADPVDLTACRAMLKRAGVENDYLTVINLYSADGKVLCSSADAPSPPVADRAWFREAVSARRMVVSDYIVGRTSGKSAVAMALPLLDGQGGVRAVLTLGIDLAWMARALARVPVAEGTNIVVVDGGGTVLAPERWVGQSIAGHPVFRRIDGIAEQTSFEAVGLDGVERIFVARPLNPDLGGRSYLWVATPKSSAAAAALRDFLGGTVLVFATVLALFAAIWWEGSRIVLQPVRQLREAARQLAGSQLSARTNLPHGEDEIGQLASTFDEMAEKIESRETELARSRASLLRTNRALRLLAALKDVVRGNGDESAFFGEVSAAVVRMGLCPMAYVARADMTAGRPLAVVAQEGFPETWRERIRLSWGDNEYGAGAAGCAVREERSCVVRDVLRDNRYKSSRDVLRKLGIEAIAGLPVRVEARVWGVLVLASRQTDAFDAEEIRLLEEVAGEIGRGIELLRLRSEKAAAEAALLEMMGGLERRVVERTAELEQANRELKAFGYSLSHDLRAPLRSIDGFALALDEECGDALNEECRNHLGRIRAAAQRMSVLIDDMIRLAQITNQEMQTVEVDLSAAAVEIGTALAAAQPSRRVRLAVASGLVARGDRGLLHALMQNLLENAWKYTGRVPEAAVEVGATSLPSGERAYYVRDNGAGFDMAFAERLFLPFSRLHRAEEFAGTGIGLATVARIASRHGGRVWAEAEKDRGATFFFVLGGQMPESVTPR